MTRAPSLVRFDALEKRVEAERVRRADLLARLEAATLRRDLALELLRPPDGARPLSALPWVAAVVSALAALYAAFAAYIGVLGGGVPWTLSGLVAVLVSLAAGAASRADGAGGNARASLRMGAMSIALLSALFLLLFAALGGR